MSCGRPHASSRSARADPGLSGKTNKEQHLVRFRSWPLPVRVVYASLVAIVFSLAPSKGNPAGLEADRDRHDRAGSDVGITDRTIRRTATVHGIISFVFNTARLTLMVNIAASAI
jgi:hypothetical protein